MGARRTRRQGAPRPTEQAAPAPGARSAGPGASLSFRHVAACHHTRRTRTDRISSRPAPGAQSRVKAACFLTCIRVSTRVRRFVDSSTQLRGIAPQSGHALIADQLGAYAHAMSTLTRRRWSTVPPRVLRVEPRERTQHAVTLRIRSFCRGALTAKMYHRWIISDRRIRPSQRIAPPPAVRLALGGGSASAVTSQQHPAHSPLRASRAMTRFIAQGSRFAAASSPWRACGRILPATPCSSEHHACCSA